jgi:tetratricopeptide (TPR) repeat protein
MNIQTFLEHLQKDPLWNITEVEKIQNYWKQYNAALESYTNAISIDPQKIIAYQDRGFVYKTLKLYPQALENFLKALEIQENDPFALSECAQISLELQQFNQTLIYASRLIKSTPQSAQAYSLCAQAYSKKGELPEAIESATQAYRLDKSPENLKQWSTLLKDRIPVALQNREEILLLPELEDFLKLAPESDPQWNIVKTLVQDLKKQKNKK